MTDTKTTTGAPDDEVTALLTASIERILSDLCTPALLRACEGEGAAGTGATALWSALEAAGLVAALAAGEGEDGALGWSEVRPMLEACGRWGLPVPLAETLAAQALARLANAALPDGATTVAAARAEGKRVIAESVAHARLATRAVVSLPDDEGAHTLWLFDLARAQLEPSVGIAEERARLSWARSEGRALGRLPAGVSALTAGAAVRCAQIAGGCVRVLRMASGYANDRVQFGRPIAKFQAIQQQLSLAGEWSAMAAMASQLALSGPGLALDAVRIASAKQVAGTAAQVCAEVAHAVHGAIGVTAEYDLQLFTRRLWTWAADFGSSLHWARALGAELVDEAPRFSWDAVVRASSV